jgi:hypothetical protein
LLLIRDDDHRLTFHEGDFVQFRERELGRIVGVFVHEMSDSVPRFFFYMSTMATEAYCKDNILNLPIYKLNSGEKKIVGLPGIQMSKRYMVPLRGTLFTSRTPELGITEDMVLACTWEVKFF